MSNYGTSGAGFRRACLALGLAAFSAGVCHAADLNVTLLDRQGRPVPDVVVVAKPVEGSVAPRRSASTSGNASRQAVMDQIDKQFVPHVLVVERGSAVTFPNSDKVSHQVYSFSPAKRFSLPLYRSQAAAPVVFDRPGIVVLGCNIHDAMIGYIYVASSPDFGKTDDQGRLTLADLSAGAYEITVWSPRFNEPQAEIKRRVQITGPSTALEVTLTRDLKPEPRHLSDHGDERY